LIVRFRESEAFMPLPVAHGLLGASIVAALGRTPAERSFKALVAGALLANAADLDFALAFALHSRAWHRGFSHSIAFSLVVCLVLVLALGRRRVMEAVAYGLAYASHGILDYLTTKEGGGVELLWPFSSERLVFGWMGLSELPSRMPAVEVVKSLVLEFALFAPLLALTVGLRKFRSCSAGSSRASR
jgi:membrane-bound metal-dependent hydrolase YbcI (DUF457 family)